MILSSGQSHLDIVSVIFRHIDLRPEPRRHVSRAAISHGKPKRTLKSSGFFEGGKLQAGTTYMAVTVMLGTTSETVLVMVCGGSVIVETNDETRVVKEVTVWVGTVRVSTDEVP